MALHLSVIIPTRNRSKLLARCLDSICQQTLSNDLFEVLIIDNGSIDDTYSVYNEYKEKIKNLNYHVEPVSGLHAGRHAGLRLAKGDILVFCDDDIRAFPTWLEGVLESFESQEVALVGGKILPDYESEPPEWLNQLWNENKRGRRLGYLSLLDFGDSICDIQPTFVWGCNFSIRKSVLIECGGFHPDAMPKELLRYRGDGETHVSTYIMKKGYKAIYNPKASVYHLVSKARMTEEYFKYRAYLQGISDSYTQIRILGDIKKKDNIILILKRFKSYIEGLKNPLKSILFNSYHDGYMFHHQEVKKDKALLKWVLKRDYLKNITDFGTE